MRRLTTLLSRLSPTTGSACRPLPSCSSSQSFEVETVAALVEAAPELCRGLLIEEEWGDVLALCRDLGVITDRPDRVRACIDAHLPE